MRLKLITPYGSEGLNTALTNRSSLEDIVTSQVKQPIQKKQESCHGFAPVFADASGSLVFPVGKALLVRFELEERKIPAAEVKKRLTEKVRDLEAKGHEVTKAEKSAMADQIRFELIDAVIPSTKSALLVIQQDSIWTNASESLSEKALNCLREALGDSLNVYPLLTSSGDPIFSMTKWLRDDSDLPDGFRLGRSAGFKDMREGGSATLKAVDLPNEQSATILESGQVTIQLEIVNLYLKLTLNDKGQLKGISSTEHMDEAIYSECEDSESLEREITASLMIEIQAINDAIKAIKSKI